MHPLHLTAVVQPCGDYEEKMNCVCDYNTIPRNAKLHPDCETVQMGVLKLF